MFGRRNSEHKHRFAESTSGDVTDAVPEAADDLDLHAALQELARNPRAPLVSLDPVSQPEPESSDAEPPVDSPDSAGPDSLAEPGHAQSSLVDELESALARSQARVEALTADLERAQSDSASPTPALQAAERFAEQLKESLEKSERRVESLTAELGRVRHDSSAGGAAEPWAADDRVAELRRSLEESQQRTDSLNAELENARSEAAAAAVALERAGREATERDAAIAELERRLEALTADLEQLHAHAEAAPAQVEKYRREAERETSLQTALKQAQASATRAESLTADNLRLSEQLTATLEGQAAALEQLAAVQREVGEHHTWIENQIRRLREVEGKHALDELRQNLAERNAELEALREQLLEVEVRRAEEAASFLDALGP